VTDRQQQSRPLRDSLFRLGGLSLLLASFALAWLIMDFQSFRDNPVAIPPSGLTLFIRPGSGLKSIARQLQQQQVLDKPAYLVFLARYLKLDARIKAGEFRLPAGITPEQLLQHLTEGKVVQHTVTLIEGETFDDMMRRIVADSVLVHELEASDGETVMAAIGYPGQHPEGRFLPETYHFPRGTTDIDFLRRAYLDMQAFLRAWLKGVRVPGGIRLDVDVDPYGFL